MIKKLFYPVCYSGSTMSLIKLIRKAERDERPNFLLNCFKEHRAYLALVSSIQAFLITNDRAKRKTEEEIIADYTARKNFTIDTALRLLSPVEQDIYLALLEKMISGNRSLAIPDVNYAREMRPYPAEEDGPVQDTEGIDKTQAREDTTPLETDEEHYHNRQIP